MINFSPWLPDIADFNTNASSDALNVIPCTTGFKPFPTATVVTSAITARVQGAATFRAASGTIYNFCGDAIKLYKMAADGLSWTDVTRTVGGAYATAIDGWWDFSQFGDYVVATNNVDAVQVFQMDSASNFSALAGSPPISAFTGVIRDFSILARKNGANSKITWSAINNVADWVASSTTMSDSQTFPDGGAVMGFVGGEYGVVLQERSIRRMSFEGPPTVFRFDVISNVLGCRAERSVAAYENLVFFLSDNGFQMVQGGSAIVPIGVEKVDRAFEAYVNAGYVYRISSAIDPINKLYVVGFPSINSGDGSPDSLYLYHWPTGQWSRCEVNHELIYTAATQTTYTIDGMDTVSATVDGLQYPVDSRFWSGAGRLSLAFFNTAHSQGFFAGTPMAATVETGDTQLTIGHKTMLRGLRPMVEGTNVTPSVKIRYRDRLQDALTDGAAVAANSNGYCPTRVNARYHRAQVTIPAASSWDFATGVDDLKFSPMGGR